MHTLHALQLGTLASSLALAPFASLDTCTFHVLESRWPSEDLAFSAWRKQTLTFSLRSQHYEQRSKSLGMSLKAGPRWHRQAARAARALTPCGSALVVLRSTPQRASHSSKTCFQCSSRLQQMQQSFTVSRMSGQVGIALPPSIPAHDANPSHSTETIEGYRKHIPWRRLL